jgi:hypothetical protein
VYKNPTTELEEDRSIAGKTKRCSKKPYYMEIQKRCRKYQYVIKKSVSSWWKSRRSVVNPHFLPGRTGRGV